MDAKRETWDIIKQDPELAAWVKEDPDLQHLLAECVSLFGVVTVERDTDEKRSSRNRAAHLRLSAFYASQGYSNRSNRRPRK